MDESAFARTAQEYAARLYMVAYRLLGNRADAQDAVQRALLKCFAARGSYSTQWAVSTWLYRILINICVDELRRRGTRAAVAERSAAAAVFEASTNHRPPGAYMDLHRALERVPREARVLLALRYVDGLSYGELARIRGISVNTVKSQLARGKSLLRTELGRRGAHHD